MDIYLAKEEDLKTLLRHENIDDTELRLALRRASDRFRGNVDHPVHRVEDDQVRANGTGTARLLLKAAPITDISVTVDGRRLTEGADYQVDRNAGILYRRPRGLWWPAGYGNVHVTYTHGWPAEEIPGDIQDAVLEHATTLAMVFAHLQQEGTGSVQATYGPAALVGTTQKWEDAVNKYKLKGRS